MANCKCPANTALTSIPTQDCRVDLEQMQKFIFQRGGYIWDAAGTPTPTDITAKADWLTLKAATDDTKVVVTPLVGGDPAIAAGEKVSNGGGDNSTLNGEEELLGKQPSVFTGVWKSLAPAVKKAMEELTCETDLVVYPVNQHNKIIAKQVDVDKYAGIPISSFFISDRNNSGFATKDTFNVSWNLPAGWDNDLVMLDPEANFRPLVDL